MRSRPRQPGTPKRLSTLVLVLLAVSSVIAACFDFDGYHERDPGTRGTAGQGNVSGIDAADDGGDGNWDEDGGGEPGMGESVEEPTADREGTTETEPTVGEPSLDQDAEAGVDADADIRLDADAGDVDAGGDVDATTDGEAGCEILVEGGACRTFPQCGCPAASGCDFLVVEGNEDTPTLCVVNGSSTQRGQKCSLLGCAPGLTCYAGACKNFCERGSDCPTLGAGCIQALRKADGGYEAIPFDWVCTDQCSLDHPEERCSPGLGCLPDDDVWIKPGHSSCAKVGKSEDTCEQGLCAPGYVCLDDGTCHRWCRPGPSADCPGIRSCKKLLNPMSGVTGFYFVDEQEFGVCM